nr:tRNA (adenosine(37)-N6)-dimethylallyltransferase MiaA [Chitinasiproducens palmae]
MPVLALLGPSASGKTATALALARAFPIEIVSVDSALVYRGMDIGTAKPDADELAAVPHHLIDIVDPETPYSAARFARDASDAIDAIAARGRLPLLVGGTMLYYRALIEPLAPLPGADATVRARLDADAAALGWPALHARLARIDPATAARLAPADAQRIQRALEVFELTGQPLSALHAAPALAVPQPYRFAALALEPSERAWLHARVARRFDAMLDHGFLHEVAALRARGTLHRDLPSMRSVGYRQAWTYLDGECDFASFRDQAIAATRQLCKRQLTWLRAMPSRTVLDCQSPDLLEQACDVAARFWSGPARAASPHGAAS